jgi:hypothetical protein
MLASFHSATGSTRGSAGLALAFHSGTKSLAAQKQRRTTVPSLLTSWATPPTPAPSPAAGSTINFPTYASTSLGRPVRVETDPSDLISPRFSRRQALGLTPRRPQALLP